MRKRRLAELKKSQKPGRNGLILVLTCSGFAGRREGVRAFTEQGD
jgi:hypothetical protein